MQPSDSVFSLRARILLLILLALAPAVGLALLAHVHQRREAAERVRESVLGQVGMAAEEHQDAVAHAATLLHGLSHVAAIRDASPELCRELLRETLGDDTRYLNLGVLAPDGRARCSIREIPDSLRPSPAGLAAVRRSLETDSFAVGGFTVEASSRRARLIVSQPLPRSGRAYPGVIYASLDPAWMHEFADQLRLPAGSTLTLLDPEGRVVVRYPHAAGWIGARAPQRYRVRELLRSDGGRSYFASGLDGVERLYASTPMRHGETIYGYAIVGIPVHAVFGDADRLLRRQLAVLGLISLLALLLTWYGADRLVVRPVRALLAATRALQAGDRSARAAVRPDTREMRQLTEAFNEMADALQRRQEETERAGEALRRSEERYRLATRATQDIIWDWDLETDRVVWSDAVERTLGYADWPRTGSAWSMGVVHPEDAPRVRESLERAIAGDGDSWSEEYRVRRADGSYAVLLDCAHIVRDAGGRAVRVTGAMMDLTRLKDTQQLLRESDSSYHSLFHSITEAVYILDEDGRFLDVNDAACAMSGYPRETLIGATPALLADPERTDLAETEAQIARAAAGETVRFEWWARRRDGQIFPKEVVIKRATYFGEDALIAVARDISERKRAEQALRDSEEQLRQAHKMEAVGRLAGGIAHDFNNLLTAIRGNLEMALLDLGPSSELREGLEQAQHASDAAATLTRQLLAFSRRQSAHPRVLCVDDLVRNTAQLLERTIGPRVELSLSLGSGEGAVLADGGQLEQVVLNLAFNARDAMPEGGTLYLETSCRTLREDDPARPAAAAAGEYVELRVRDTGRGMDEATQQRIFEPFFTTKQGETEKGTGLGLFTVYGVIRQLRGHIVVQSAPGAGTTIRVLIPRAAEGAAEGRARDGEALPGGRETVLLVEDEPAVRMLAQRLLQRIGYHVLEAGDGEEALQVAARHPEPIDLLLTDMSMPRMGGRELAEQMRQQSPSTRVVYMSGYTEELLPLGRVAGPPGSFIHKPFTLNVLARAVREALDSGAPTG